MRPEDGRREETMQEPGKKITRRSFLGSGIATVLGTGLGMNAAGAIPGLVGEEGQEPDTAKKPPDAPKIRDYRSLGRTGFEVSDISFGNAAMKDSALLEYAIDRGINYVDSARQYYDMEKVIGRLFPAKREGLFVTTKLLPELFTKDVTKEEIVTAIDESLERLNTDYIDCCLIHSVGEDPGKPDRTVIDNPEIYRGFELAKKAGKIRFWGASSHGPKMAEEFSWLMENTDIDIIMPGMNMMTGGLPPLLEKAKKKGIGVVAMKSLSTARKIDYSDYRKEGRTARQALLGWMLAQPDIDTIAVTMRSFEEIDEFVAASGQTEVSGADREFIERHAESMDRIYCRPGCVGCLGACPGGVLIPDILRYRLYFEQYGREKYAMNLYRKLSGSRTAAGCRSCEGVCEGSCPHRIAIRTRLIEAHDLLTV